MNIDWNLVGLIGIPVVCVFLTAWVTHVVEKRPKLRHYLAHATGIRLSLAGQQPMVVNTHSVELRNAGRKTETNVRLGHRPVQFWYQVFPGGLHTERPLVDGGREIVFERLVPGKAIHVTYLYLAPIMVGDVNTHIEGDSGASKLVYVQPTPIVPKWLLAVLWLLIASGLVAWLYLLVVWLRA